MGRYLVIVEVSQKQAYIFASNKLQDNIRRSEEIVKVTSKEYFSKVCENVFDAEKNYIYAGGGHTILEFESEDEAKEFNSKLTFAVMKEYPDMELFVKTMEYDDTKTPGTNLQELTKKLEEKKALRRSSFNKGSFGVEEIDSYSLRPKRATAKKEVDNSVIDAMIPDGFKAANKFEDLGGSVGESNFIAVVHIDGNGMGKRVSVLYKDLDEKKLSWEEYKKKIRDFSDGIDKDFKDSFREMTNIIANLVMKGDLSKLSLKENSFPIRKLIMSGDDVCFVTDGRIGIEGARILIEKLRNKTNAVDNKGYEACAGIAIVHSKYPFFRAYELSEGLCSNAKRMCASLDKENNGALLSAIDWHISFGELYDSVEDIRDDYVTDDNKHLELRPYLINGNKELLDLEKARRYNNFRKLVGYLQDQDETFARSTLKQLRNVLKKGEQSTDNYLRFHKIQELVSRYYYDIFEQRDLSKIGTGEYEKGKMFFETYDKKQRSIIFDAIEIMDTFLLIGEG